MLPLVHQIAFFLFALTATVFGGYGFYRLYLRIRRGQQATEPRFDDLPQRIGQAIVASISQERTFRHRPWISVLHSFIFYGFVFYLLVNVIDGLEGYIHFSISSRHPVGAIYNFWADTLSILVFIGVIGLIIRRLYHPSKRDFRFTENTPVHEQVKSGYILRDSLIVSVFILFHVGCRILGNSAKMVEEAHLHHGSYDWVQIFSSSIGQLLFSGLSEQALLNWRIFGFWGALGSILAFLCYFPYTKHIHLFMAPLNYAFKRPVPSGVIPDMPNLESALEEEEPKLGASKIEDLEWPRLLDAYACIQCNRCQDVCPAHTTGKALSPAALEINKRMELNMLTATHTPFILQPTPFESGESTARPLLEFAINQESIWGCTTCGACMQVCPVQNEQMLDIIDIRRQQVMVEGEFPSQLQTAFRGMERAQNPWGISKDKRMEWAEGLPVPTIDENPTPDVIYWVGCAASYDPGAQKVARSFVQLLHKAGVNYAVLGKKEACTGDAARRAGNEFLYQQLAQQNVETLNKVEPKLIVATCPHCMNAIGQEYQQLGGNYQTIHHTEYLETLVNAGKLPISAQPSHVAYHDPCYLGRHNGVYEAPRNLLTQMAGEILSLERERDTSFCCGAGGAQFWKEEEEGSDRVADNRFREIQTRLDQAAERSREYAETGQNKTVAVGCPFCKAMINSAPNKQEREDIVVKDVAELMWEAVDGQTEMDRVDTEPPAKKAAMREAGQPQAPEHSLEPVNPEVPTFIPFDTIFEDVMEPTSTTQTTQEPAQTTQRKAWKPKDSVTSSTTETQTAQEPTQTTQRKTWKPKDSVTSTSTETQTTQEPTQATQRKTWKPKDSVTSTSTETQTAQEPTQTTQRKTWKPKDSVTSSTTETQTTQEPTQATQRKAWKPKDSVTSTETQTTQEPTQTTQRKAWKPKDSVTSTETQTTQEPTQTTQRKAWKPKDSVTSTSTETQTAQETTQTTQRKAWKPKDSVTSSTTETQTAQEPTQTTQHKAWKPKSTPEEANTKTQTAQRRTWKPKSNDDS